MGSNTKQRYSSLNIITFEAAFKPHSCCLFLIFLKYHWLKSCMFLQCSNLKARMLNNNIHDFQTRIVMEEWKLCYIQSCILKNHSGSKYQLIEDCLKAYDSIHSNLGGLRIGYMNICQLSGYCNVTYIMRYSHFWSLESFSQFYSKNICANKCKAHFMLVMEST